MWTEDFIIIEMFAISMAICIGTCLWGIFKVVETLAQDYAKEQEKQNTEN